MAFLFTAALSYLLGSIPFGYILVRAFHKRDIRQTGSGNIGATNVSRTSPKLGVLTLILDALKGLAAVALAHALYPQHKALGAVAAFFAIVGHIFPVWLKFRGGKGVATGLGSFVMLAPRAVLLALGIFVVVALVFRRVSLASIITAALLPILIWLLGGADVTPPMLAWMAAASILIIAKHHENIARLIAGTETRFALRRG